MFHSCFWQPLIVNWDSSGVARISATRHLGLFGSILLFCQKILSRKSLNALAIRIGCISVHTRSKSIGFTKHVHVQRHAQEAKHCPTIFAKQMCIWCSVSQDTCKHWGVVWYWMPWITAHCESARAVIYALTPMVTFWRLCITSPVVYILNSLHCRQ